MKEPCRLLGRWALVALLGFASVLGAEARTVITPSDRVETRLNVREEPAAGSPVVGKLERNETADLLDSIPYWYHVRLFNGVEGYVAKAWSSELVLLDAPERRIRLGAWNVKKLGHGAAKDFGAVASVIEAHFDVLALVEVMQKGGGHPGYDRLVEVLGTGWRGLVTDTPRPNNPSDGSAEFYAVIYRDGVARPCHGWEVLRYHEDGDGSAGDTRPDVFSREPAYGCFEAGFDAGPAGVDFLLGVYHARWADGNEIAILGEVNHVDEVMAGMAVARPGEKDIVLTGDFNLRPEALAGVTKASDRTTGEGSTLNLEGHVTANLYDHLLLRDEAASSEFLGNARVLDVRQVAVAGRVFYQTVSDHLPIVIEVRVGGPDDD